MRALTFFGEDNPVDGIVLQVPTLGSLQPGPRLGMPPSRVAVGSGNTIEETAIEVVAKLSPTGKLVIITVYAL